MVTEHAAACAGPPAPEIIHDSEFRGRTGEYFRIWVVVGALRFRARNAAWSGVPFRFDGSLMEGYRNCLDRYAFVIPTIGLACPYVRQCQRAYINGEHRFGTTRFVF